LRGQPGQVTLGDRVPVEYGVPARVVDQDVDPLGQLAEGGGDRGRVGGVEARIACRRGVPAGPGRHAA